MRAACFEHAALGMRRVPALLYKQSPDYNSTLIGDFLVAQALACVLLGCGFQIPMNSTKQPRMEGFQELDPWQAEDLLFRRRNLPHLEVSGATYFVTFRSKIALPPAARDVLLAETSSCDGKCIDLVALVVMPDHVHLIFQLHNGVKLSQVLRLIKGRAARFINQKMTQKGQLWLDESFDHIIRSQAELEEKIEYIKQNPVKKGLAAEPSHYRWLLLAEPRASEK